MKSTLQGTFAVVLLHWIEVVWSEVESVHTLEEGMYTSIVWHIVEVILVVALYHCSSHSRHAMLHMSELTQNARSQGDERRGGR